jgi:hypothetical protein
MTGSDQGAGKLRRQRPNLRSRDQQSARLTHSTTPERGSGCSRNRTCGRPRGRLAGSNGRPRSSHCSTKRKERESNPKAREPARFRDGIPRRWQSFPELAPAGVEPAPSRVRTGSSAVLIRSLDDVTGRDRTCDAPRFRRALYRAELRPRELGGVGLNRRPSRIRAALPHQGPQSMGELGLGPIRRSRTSVLVASA